MPQINPHINFNGNAEEAFQFYKSVFGGEFTKIIRFKDIESESFPVPESEKDKIMHIELPIGSSKLMANDVPSIFGKVNENENRSKIYVNAQTIQEADSIFEGLSAGGNIEVPMNGEPEGSYFGMFRDKFGIEWIINLNV